MTRGIAFRRCIGYIHRHYGKEDLAAEPPGDNRKEGRRDRRCTDVSKCTCTSLSPSPCTQVCETREIRGCCRKYVFCRSNLGRHVLFFAQFQSRYCSHFDGGLWCFCVSVYANVCPCAAIQLDRSSWKTAAAAAAPIEAACARRPTCPIFGTALTRLIDGWLTDRVRSVGRSGVGAPTDRGGLRSDRRMHACTYEGSLRTSCQA